MTWFIIILLIYTILLYFLGTYEMPSLIYHTLLLAFPLGLVLGKRANIQSFGLVKGIPKVGLSLSLIAIILAFLLSLLRFKLSLPELHISLLATVIYAPITEELFFRGYLQPKLQGRFGRWLGLIITAVLFTIIHLPKVFLTPLAAPSNLLLFFVLGVVFGIIRDESDSVYYPILCHAGYNAVTAFFTIV